MKKFGKTHSDAVTSRRLSIISLYRNADSCPLRRKEVIREYSPESGLLQAYPMSFNFLASRRQSPFT